MEAVGGFLQEKVLIMEHSIHHRQALEADVAGDDDDYDDQLFRGTY